MVRRNAAAGGRAEGARRADRHPHHSCKNCFAVLTFLKRYFAATEPTFAGRRGAHSWDVHVGRTTLAADVKMAFIVNDEKLVADEIKNGMMNMHETTTLYFENAYYT